MPFLPGGTDIWDCIVEGTSTFDPMVVVSKPGWCAMDYVVER